MTDDTKPVDNPRPPEPVRDADSDGRKRVSVRELMGDDRDIVLVHEGSDYTLRITSNGRLILTK